MDIDKKATTLDISDTDCAKTGGFVYVKCGDVADVATLITHLRREVDRFLSCFVLRLALNTPNCYLKY